MNLEVEVKYSGETQTSEEVSILINDNVNLTLSNPKTRCSIFIFAEIDESERDFEKSFDWAHTSDSQN